MKRRSTPPIQRLRLADFARSTASWRVRIALHWKGLDWQTRPVDLARGEQLGAKHLAANPQALIPTLYEDEMVLSQSVAILEYLEEMHPEPPLLPRAPRDRAFVRQLALLISCDVHPLQNLRVRRYLEDAYHLGEDDVTRWCRHWIDEGLDAYEKLVAPLGERFSTRSAPSLADVCLVPQLYNARRYGCDVSRWPNLLAIEKECGALPAFRDAAPEQPPAPSSFMSANRNLPVDRRSA